MKETERRGNWCETYTGRKFWTLDPHPEEVNIVDIAHALSQICRHGGHTKHFYSVAQHSINVARELDKAGYNEIAQLYGLIHDAAEAYICDLPRPIKRCMDRYSDYEHAIQLAIYRALSILPPTEMQQSYIDHMDNEVLYNEAIRITNNTDTWAVPSEILGIDVSLRNMADVEAEFMALYYKLISAAKTSFKTQFTT